MMRGKMRRRWNADEPKTKSSIDMAAAAGLFEGMGEDTLDDVDGLEEVIDLDDEDDEDDDLPDDDSPEEEEEEDESGFQDFSWKYSSRTPEQQEAYDQAEQQEKEEKKRTKEEKARKSADRSDRKRQRRAAGYSKEQWSSAPCPPVSSDALAVARKLEDQLTFFPIRVPKISQKGFVRFFPWLELKERTIPLIPAKAFGAAVEADTFTYFAGKTKKIILVVRRNGNTQMIIPAKSVTTYTSRSGDREKEVWSPNAEFITYDYKVLLEEEGQEALKSLKDYSKNFYRESDVPAIKMGAIAKDAQVKKLELGETNNRTMINLTLCNSLQVAIQYVNTVWRALPNSTKRFSWPIAIFEEVDKGKVVHRLSLNPPRVKESTQSSNWMGGAIRELKQGRTTQANPRLLPNRGRRRRRQVRLMPRDH
jgi:hypothetical protein